MASEEEKQVITCDICGVTANCSKDEELVLECCGVKYCFLCSSKTDGLCHVCKKDELNEPVQCDICGEVGNQFLVQMCDEVDGKCDMLVCGKCSFPHVGDHPFKYCSHRHFQEMLDDVFRRS